ncbi:hypothetical protein [Tunturiibacter gelidiferens]|uniref:Uncharacterized protein n=1 Tax=Tunturiibacter gelidiferens TaxID=3069689 RepID=A0AAU7Z5K7_9BACT
MRRLTRIIFAVLLCICLGRKGSAQGVTGSTSIDFDEVSGMLIATCETDLDATTQVFYKATVECTVKDDDGNIVATGRFLDKKGTQGYAQVVLSFPGVPGTNYIASADHSLEVELERSVDPFSGQSDWYDPFNFGDLEKLHDSYRNMYEWFGPGTGQTGQTK